MVVALECACAQVALAMEDAAWLYSVELPVSAQSTAERERAASEGLLIVLSRLTGLSSVPRNDAITQALARPQPYYNRFVFVSEPTADGEQQTIMRFTFQAGAVQQLITEAQLPVWWSKRHRIMAWTVVDEDGGREILNSASAHPVALALQDRARQRGLPLSLPLMDLDDQLAVTPADVWGKVAASLDTASQRYSADLVLIGRITRNPGYLITDQPYRGDWEIWINGRPLVVNFDAATAEQAVGEVVDVVADRLAEQFAVLPRQLSAHRVMVTGLDDAASYAAFMSYVGSFEFVDFVGVSALDARAVEIWVNSRALPEQLEMLLTTEGRLVRDKLHRGLDLQLIWRG